VTSRPAPRRPLARAASLSWVAPLARGAPPAAAGAAGAAGAALAAGVILGWAAASRPAALLAGHGPAGSGRGAASLAIGALAVALAAANGFAKAYSP
jgi:hypothetical protein